MEPLCERRRLAAEEDERTRERTMCRPDDSPAQEGEPLTNAPRPGLASYMGRGMWRRFAPAEGSHPLANVCFCTWVLAVQLVGLAAFTKGFFLTRVELGSHSQCEIRSLLTEQEIEHLSDSARELYRSPATDGSSAGACWLPPRFKRVVWVVIDALRYDFAAYEPPAYGGHDGDGEHRRHQHKRGAKHYLNHLPVIHQAMGGVGPGDASPDFQGSGGVLFQFEADPPTVTMQRLKGLTTGGLPTFIDFRDNFHSPEIAEDNWVAQMRNRAARRQRGRSDGNDFGDLVFMGDDTWTSLYPTYFTRSYPFLSFNTRDLHTVDDGVLSHLSSELANDNWEVLVAHFLGVDHVGHTFGPASQAMEDKLEQMDAALRTVFSAVDDDTVVFVLGDHGMTEDGNHGGATAEETGAALFIWSRSGQRLLGPDLNTDTRPRDQEAGLGGRAAGSHATDRAGHGAATPSSGRQVAQIDLVPTVSLLLGIPIPFGNLGGVIPEVFGGRYDQSAEAKDASDDSSSYERLCDALLVNSLQVWRYLTEYAKVASMPKEEMFDLEELLTTARNLHTEWRVRRKRSAALGRGPESASELARVCDAYRAFLDASISLGRSVWTQYDTGLMRWGLAVLLAATLALAARVLFSEQVVDDRIRVTGGDRSAFAAAARPEISIAGLLGGAAGGAGALVGDAVFGASGGHVFVSKVAICSCTAVIWRYGQTGWERNSLRGRKTYRRSPDDGSKGPESWMSTPGASTWVLAMLYCAGLFSNSFIEAEDGLHRFLSTSSLLSLSTGMILRGSHDTRVRGKATEALQGALRVPHSAVSALLAAVCLRLATAVQESVDGVAISTTASFSVRRSLLPLPVVWLACAVARGGRFTPTARAKRLGLHGILQGLSLLAVGAYWVNESMASVSVSVAHESRVSEPAIATREEEDTWSVGSLVPPLRLALPRLAYIFCAMGIAVALAAPAIHQRSTHRARSPSDGDRKRSVVQDGRVPSAPGVVSYANAVALTASNVVCHLFPVVIVLLGPGSAAGASLVAIACGCLVRSASIAARTAVGDFLPNMAIAWAIAGRSFFFLTGHHNQFSRLQYSAAFVGFDEFDFKIGGVLLFVNTFGTEILAALALPMLAAAATPATPSPMTMRGAVSPRGERQESVVPGATQGMRSRQTAAAHGLDRRKRFAEHGVFGDIDTSGAVPQEQIAAPFLGTMERLSGLLLLLSSVRTFLSAANVSVQRGHLMLWAVFAPKFVFDATMQAVCGAAGVVAWVVVLIAHRAYGAADKREHSRSF